MLFDSHCHIYEPEFDAERQAVLERARAAGIHGMIAIGASGSVASCHRALALAEVEPDVWATVGIHPHDVKDMDEVTFAEVRRLAASTRVVGIGESGLDYHYDHSPRPLQRAAFERFCALACELGKTLVVHIRDAHEDALAILSAQRPVRTVIHCFTGGPRDAERYLELGCYISFSGIATFKSATEIREAALLVPPSHLLIETDAPFLAPIPLRGRRNEPSFLLHTATCLAKIRGESLADFAALTTANARLAFALDG